MENQKDKLFAEINDQHIRYAVFELKNNSNYNFVIKKNSNNSGIKSGLVVDQNIASQKIAEDIKDI